MNKKENENEDVTERKRLAAARDVLVTYLVMKTEEEDWHAVADAAMDLRELDAKLYIKVMR